MLPAILKLMTQGGYRKAGNVFFKADLLRSCVAIKRQHTGFTKLAKRQAGFTIVEVMIVLAVTGIMFVAAATTINGRQNETEFTTAINALQQRLQQIANETASGFYPNSGNFICTGSSTGAATFTAGSNQQGTNGGCIFMGKAIQFGLGTGTNANSLGILPLVGNQYQSGTLTPVLTVAQARPRAVYPGASESGVPDTSSTDYMENGLTVAASNNDCGSGLGGICYTDNVTGTKVATGVLAFVSGDSKGNITALDGSGNVQAGSQQLSLYGVSSSAPNQTRAQATDAIGGTSNPYVSHLSPASSASVCIASGTTNQSGLFTIDSGLHVTLIIRSGTAC